MEGRCLKEAGWAVQNSPVDRHTSARKMCFDDLHRNKQAKCHVKLSSCFDLINQLIVIRKIM